MAAASALCTAELWQVPGFEVYSNKVRRARKTQVRCCDELVLTVEKMVPQTAKLNSIFETALNLAIANAQFLAFDPGKSARADDLRDSLRTLVEKLEVFKEKLSWIDKQLDGHLSDLERYIASFDDWADTAFEALQNEKEGCSAILGAFDAMKNALENLTDEAIGRSLSGGAVVFGAYSALKRAGVPFGIRLGAALEPQGDGFKGSIEKLCEAEKAAEALLRSAKAGTLGAAILKINATLYRDFVSSVGTCKDNSAEILEGWNIIIKALTKAINQIEASKLKINGHQWENVSRELKTALDEWHKMVKKIQLLKVAVKGSLAEFEAGMTAAQVKNALNFSRTVKLSAYLKYLG